MFLKRAYSARPTMEACSFKLLTISAFEDGFTEGAAAAAVEYLRVFEMRIGTFERLAWARH